jgi:hypothetical protein
MKTPSDDEWSQVALKRTARLCELFTSRPISSSGRGRQDQNGAAAAGFRPQADRQTPREAAGHSPIRPIFCVEIPGTAPSTAPLRLATRSGRILMI